jgi:hypothetical protein
VDLRVFSKQQKVSERRTDLLKVNAEYFFVGSDPNTLIECTSFSTIGKIQPFLVSVSTNAVLVMDFHCHLTTSEVVGYLAGHWDVNAHSRCSRNL